MIAAAFTHSCCLIREDFEEQYGNGKEVPVAFEMGAHNPALALIEGSKGGGGENLSLCKMVLDQPSDFSKI